MCKLMPNVVPRLCVYYLRGLAGSAPMRWREMIVIGVTVPSSESASLFMRGPSPLSCMRRFLCSDLALLNLFPNFTLPF